MHSIRCYELQQPRRCRYTSGLSYPRAQCPHSFFLSQLSGSTSTAHQRFLSTGPIAMLPMGEGWASLVWTLPARQAQQMVTGRPALAAQVGDSFQGISASGGICDEHQRSFSCQSRRSRGAATSCDGNRRQSCISSTAAYASVPHARQLHCFSRRRCPFSAPTGRPRSKSRTSRRSFSGRAYVTCGCCGRGA